MITAQHLVNYTLAQIGRPYWWGTYGQVATPSLYEAKKKQYPSYYTATDFASQYGKRVHDCAGLIKGALWSEFPNSVPRYVPAQDLSAQGLYEHCSARGVINSKTLPVGALVFYSNLGHVGVYVGNGEVVEAMGHAYGVRKTKLDERSWHYWGLLDFVDYDEKAKSGQLEPEKPNGSLTGSDMDTIRTFPVLHRGVTGTYVKVLQLALNVYNKAGLDVDGEFGPLTDAALRAWQKQKNIEVDGICGEQSWASIFA